MHGARLATRLRQAKLLYAIRCFSRREGKLYELTVKSHFDAAHVLGGYPGECSLLHGHTWDIEVTVAGETLDEIGIVYDFKQLKSDLAQVLERYDHVYLNDVEPFNTINPTAENLARVIFEALAEKVDRKVSVKEVVVWESPVARIVYRAQG